MTPRTPEELAATLDEAPGEPSGGSGGSGGSDPASDEAVVLALRRAQFALQRLAEDAPWDGADGHDTDGRDTDGRDTDGRDNAGDALDETMPADVAARLDAAIAAAPAPPRPDSERTGTVTMLPSVPQQRGASRALLAAAAALVLIVVAGGLVAVTRGGSSGAREAGTAAAPAAAAASASAQSVIVADSGSSYADADALAVGVRSLLAGALPSAGQSLTDDVRNAAASAAIATGTPAAFGQGLSGLGSSGGSAALPPATAAPPAAPPAAAAATASYDLSSSTGGTGVGTTGKTSATTTGKPGTPAHAGGTTGSGATGSGTAGTTTSGGTPRAAPSPAPRSAAPAAVTTAVAALPPDLAACLLQIGPKSALLAVDTITYAGQPSLLAVYADGPGRVAAWVVGPDCAVPGANGLRTVSFVGTS